MITLENFTETVEWFFTEASKIEDGWSLEYNDIGHYKYLRKKSHIHKKEHLLSSTHYDVDDDEVIPADDNYYITDHHFLYSTSYNVPIVFFNIYTKEGGLVSLEDVWKLIKERCPQTASMQEQQFWSFVTQQEHPFLCRPFFSLHPCHSDHFMHQISKQHSSHKQYFLAWISSISPYVLLELPINYAGLANQT